jgi:four helix bundle protein
MVCEIMETGAGEDLTQRTFRFASDIYDYCAELSRVPGPARQIAWQLFDAATSVGANREEAKGAYSRREFAAKTGIVLKECREANFWLRLADAKSLGNKNQRLRLLRESNELIAIFTRAQQRLQG